jgi:endo-alpha-1,4-polygalactosaminidase (GH114 family)
MKILAAALFSIVLIACSGINDEISENQQPNSNYVIPIGKTFEWRLDSLNNNYSTNADVIDIDAFSATADLVANLKAQGKTVIAYLSVGSVENYRPDTNEFPESIIGNDYEGYPDEKWLDIRQIELLAPIMEARFNMIKNKGFDGIEPDNMNGYQNNTGFNISEEDAIVYSRWLIEQAHSRQLSIGQKNAEELIPILFDEFDWVLAEDAFVDDFYEELSPFISVGKAVFLVEYTDIISSENFQTQICPEAISRNYSAVLKNRDLTDVTFYCN